MKPESRQRILIILGMHRSGTSLLASWLTACGLNLGERQLAEGPGNVRGHFEDLDFHDFHESVFQECNIPSGGLENYQALKISDKHKTHASLLIKKRQKQTQWGWKEPRTCLFLDLYDELLDNYSVLVVYRHYTEVADSLIRRDFQMFLDNLQPQRRLKNLRRRLRWFLEKRKLQKQHLRRLYADMGHVYLETWIDYNQRILDLLQTIPRQNSIVVDTHAIAESQSKIHRLLTERGFKLEDVDYSRLLDSRLMKKGVIQGRLRLSIDQQARADSVLEQLGSLSI